jgi:hypothetical protein
MSSEKDGKVIMTPVYFLVYLTTIFQLHFLNGT